MREWLIFFLAGVEETANASANVFAQILELKARIDGQVLPRFAARRQSNAQALVRHLYKRPIIDVKQASEVIGAANNTASSLISDLVAHGVLNEITQQRRNRLFVFNP